MNDYQLMELLKANKTPCYTFDLPKLKKRIEHLRERLPGGVGLCYAVKANTFILKTISALVDRLELCSPGELRIASQLKLDPGQFVVSGVYKDPQFLEEIISEKLPVGYYTVESMVQFSTLYNNAKKYRHPICVFLRLTSGNQFGLEKYEIELIVDHYKEDPWIDIRGIQYYSGTQKNAIKRLKRELYAIDQFLEKLAASYGYRAAELEFGPGLPVAYFNHEDFDEDIFLSDFSTLLNEMNFKGKITLELGRSIAASCGDYITQVVDVKMNHEQNYAIVDGGIHHLVYYGQSLAMRHPDIRCLPQEEGGTPKNWNICGSLCTVGDILIKNISIPHLSIGSYLIFKNTGAYCMTEGMALFLSRDLPQIFLIQPDGTLECVRDALAIDSLNTPTHEKRLSYGTIN